MASKYRDGAGPGGSARSTERKERAGRLPRLRAEGGRLRELVAPPRWLVRLAKPQPGPVPWAQALRAAIAMTAPISLGLATGNPVPGLLGSIGALSATNADRGGPYRLRALRVGLAVVAGAFGFLLGGLVHGRGWVAVGAVCAIAFTSAVVGVIGAVASVASLQFLIFATVASGLALPVPFWLPPLLFLAGGAWALLLSLSGWLGRGPTPEREAVADVYRNISGVLAAVGMPWTEQARQSLTTALNTAYDTLLTYRTRASGQDPRYRQLIMLLNEATPVIEATLTVMREGRELPREVPRAVSAIADAVVRQDPSPDLSELDDLPELYARSPGMSALASALDSVTEVVGGRQPREREAAVQPPRLRERALATWDRVMSGRATWLYAGRLVLCMGFAAVLSEVAAIQRSYWVMLTVAVVLKPDFGSVFARAVQRGAGTVVGVLIGAGILAGVPLGPAILPFIALFAALLPIGLRRHYGMFSTFVTPLIILLIDLLAGGGLHLVTARLIDTLIGCGIVLVLGYLLWPETWHVRVGQQFAGTVDDVTAYLSRALGPDQEGRSLLRRHTYRRLSDLRTIFQQTLAEPPPVSTRASAWWPAIVALERVTDAVTSVVVSMERDSREPSRAGVDMLVRAMEDLAAAVRGQRPPHPLPLPGEEPLTDVAAEVRTARSVFSGPPLEGTPEATGTEPPSRA